MDWNNDGNLDIIVGEYGVKTGTPTGKVHFFERQNDGSLKASQLLKCNNEEITIRYTAPCIVDWNNDGLLDMLLGHVDDTINGVKNRAPHLYINDGTKEQYHFSERQLLEDEYGVITHPTIGRSHIKVSDLNNDGKKDVVITSWAYGSPGEKFYYHENIGTDEAPLLKGKVELQTPDGSALATSAVHRNARFTFWDWNNDGYEDIIWADYKQSKVSDTCEYNISTNPIYISFSSTNGVIDTEAPTVEVTSPNGGEEYKAGDTITIEWDADDNVGIVSEVVKLSLDDGASWKTLQALRGSGQYRLPDSVSSQAKIKVTVADAAQFSSSDISDAVFAISPVTSVVSLLGGTGGGNVSLESGVLSLAGEDVTAVRILSLQGEVLFAKEGALKGDIAIPLLSKGMYLIEMHSRESQTLRRVVLK